MGRLADWGFGHKESKTCSKCGMEKKEGKDNGCCKDVHKFVKNSSDQKATSIIFHLQKMMPEALPVAPFVLSGFDYSSFLKNGPASHAPPRCTGLAVYIRNCVFLI
jgi:hypothetical protein